MLNFKADTHNFGRSVYSSDSKVMKPRPLLWESLFLSRDSNIRSMLHGFLLEAGQASAFDMIPSLKFRLQSGPNQVGEVDKYKLSSMEVPSLTSDDLENIGSLIGMFTWFGISDIHMENVFIGNDCGRLIVLPFDIESIFNSYTLPSQTLLISPINKQYTNYGLRHLIESPLLSNVSIDELGAQLLQGYLSTINILNKKSQVINNEILSLPFINTTPIRVILRKTKEYRSAIDLITYSNSSFIEEEVIQMKRGDIPYFFRYFNSNNVYFYTNKDLTLKKVVDKKVLRTSFPKTYRDECFSVNLSENSRKKEILTLGILQLIKFIRDNSKSKRNYQYTYKEISVEVNSEYIKLKINNGEYLVCKNN